MNLTKSIFILVYLISPISYLIIYSIFTLIRKNDILISIYQILPMLAIYYLVASVIASIFFEKIIKKIQDVNEKE
ncbi:Uncharacterised protein [Staphylococcus aureus]|uniref:Uncharacterized protein n=1 Tax=Staphylococcus aureus TaxID=1280 RepID=A0A7Z1SA52_STAAU|nr:hypothetical protein UG86_00500 [Staphylococcus aureus]EWC67473.1 hypothetical protein W893_00055 [Staphylococcus aureus subsp. aureus ST 1413]CAI79767.1 hypothetical protein SAB0079c [Staphylococcus aureus RF122]VTS19319.1 Uncharacterised protein [Staphylococcus hyicus]ALO32864.1 hypothetical protein ASU36_12340 [Staphylococcus aureus]